MTEQSLKLIRSAAVHIFDVDHTLTSHSTGRRYALAGVRKGMFSRRELMSLPFMYLQYRLGKLSLQRVTREIRSIKGKRYEELARLARDTFERSGRNDLFPQAVEYLATCRREGRTVVLASSSFDVILEPLRDYLQVDHMICSELAYEDGVATGWFTDGPCYAQVKAERITRYLEEQEISAEDVAFYSDSFHDLPSLQLAGTAVPVNPDILLRQLAKVERWPVLNWKRRPGDA